MSDRRQADPPPARVVAAGAAVSCLLWLALLAAVVALVKWVTA